jgi:hypothetical protein
VAGSKASSFLKRSRPLKTEFYVTWV